MTFTRVEGEAPAYVLASRGTVAKVITHGSTRRPDTANTNQLFSHRAEKGVTGRMMAAVGMRPSLKRGASA